MKSKKLIALLAIVLILITLTGCSLFKGEEEEKAKEEPKRELSAFEEEYGEYKPKMWVVENEELGNKVYLLGSIHMGVAEMYPLPSKIEEAFNESEILAVENDIIELEKDMALAVELFSYLTYTDGTTLKDHLTEKQLKDLKELGKKYNFPILEEDIFKPIFYYTYITQMHVETTKYSVNYGIDRYLLEKAKEKGMRVVEIEDARITYELLSGISEETESYLIDGLITSYSYAQIADMSLDFTFKCWVTGDMKAYSDSMKSDDPRDEEYLEAFLYTRNKNMADKVTGYFETGKTYFYVVGALHFEGERGIIDLLTQQGYDVTEVKY